MWNLIGDTHFGRKFKTGVPIHRRGELETLFYKKFEEALYQDEKLTIQLGDLFDSPIVDLDTIDSVFTLIHRASRLRPNREFIFIRGNHDASRNSAQATAFEILIEMCGRLENVHFVTDTLRLGNNVFIGWDYHREEPLSETFKRADVKEDDVIFGHFEEPVDPYLLSVPNSVYSGHIHKKHDVGNIHFVGSLLPIAFGEESDDMIMETVTLDELKERDPESIKHKRIRVLLKEGEEAPDSLDCLQLIVKREDKEDNQIVLDVETECVDMRKLFDEELSESGMSEELYKKYTLRKNK